MRQIKIPCIIELHLTGRGLTAAAVVVFALVFCPVGQGALLTGGADHVFVLDAQHPRLYTTQSYALKHFSKLIDAVAPQRFVITDKGGLAPIGKKTRKIDWNTYVHSAHQLGVKVLPIIRNFAPGALFSDPNALDKAVHNIAGLCSHYHFDGVVLDIEHLTEKQRQTMTKFASRIYAWMQAHHRLLILCVGARAWNHQWNYVALSKNCDGFFVMFYDYTGGWTKGRQPGPTAPMASWPGQPHTIAGDLNALLAMGVPANKIIMGIAEYGYDFTLDSQGMVVSAKAYWIAQLRNMAEKYHAVIRWSKSKQAPFFNYTDTQGRPHQVWLESARTYRAKLHLAHSKGIAGIATWASYWTARPAAKNFWPTVKTWLHTLTANKDSAGRSGREG